MKGAERGVPACRGGDREYREDMEAVWMPALDAEWDAECEPRPNADVLCCPEVLAGCGGGSCCV